MEIFFACASVALILSVLIDGYELMILPRRVGHSFRFARVFYRTSWRIWRTIAVWMPRGKSREAFLSWFGPLSLLLLLGGWATGLIVGFGFLHWSLHIPLHVPTGEAVDLGIYLYMSGTTFFTLGFGDVTPLSHLGRILIIFESGLGFAFLASIIGYMPVLYQAFARCEATISLLDARAGSPPTAFQFLARIAGSGNLEALPRILIEWEHWAAEVLEAQLSHSVLSFYRSQHDNQSWLAALTAILDTCAIHLAAVKDDNTYQAQLTFAMARHLAVDISMTLGMAPAGERPDRLSPEEKAKLWQALAQSGLVLPPEAAIADKLKELRGMYEPFVQALSDGLLFQLPGFRPEKPAVDNWQTSAWMRRTPGIGALPLSARDDEHFD